MDLRKLSEETIKEYFARLCENKVAYNISWVDIAELMNSETGDNFGESKYRKQWKYYDEGRKDGFKQAVDSGEPLKKFEDSLLKLEEEKVKVRDRHVALNRTIRAKARFENIIDELKEHMDNVLEPLSITIDLNKNNGKDKILVVAFSDFHAGAEFNNAFGEYSPAILRRRLQEYLEKIIEVGTKENIGTVKVLGLGDLCSGVIHVSTRLQNAENVIEQIQNVSEYIAQALTILSGVFENVEYHSVVGNHGRTMASKEESLLDENYEKLIPWYVKARVSEIENIEVCDNTVDSGIVVTSIFDNVIFACHGDKDSFDRASMVLPMMLKTFPESIWLGHLHSFGVESKYDIQTIRSGSMSGTDEYAKDKRLSGSACQTMAIYNREGLECIYNVKFK